MPDSPPRELFNYEKDCVICSRPAVCRNYGAITCDACKMFFRRTITERLRYVCKKENKCMDSVTAETKPICRGCRLQKCLEMGMEFFPRSLGILEVQNKTNEDFIRVLRDLTAMSSSWYLTLLNFYTEDDPSLEDILNGKKAVVTKKQPHQRTTTEQWTFFANYILISSFTNFAFVQKLSFSDKLVLFRSTAMKNCLLCSAMRSFKDKKDRPCTPDGQEVYPEEFPKVLSIEPQVLKRICSLLVSRVIELQVTDDEFILILLIFFCNPALPSLSDDGRSVLGTYQKMYTSALFQHCQIKHQKAAPSRLTDLLSLCHLANKVYQDLQYITMVFQLYVPKFKFYKLAVDTLELSENVDNGNKGDDG